MKKKIIVLGMALVMLFSVAFLGAGQCIVPADNAELLARLAEIEERLKELERENAVLNEWVLTRHRESVLIEQENYVAARARRRSDSNLNNFQDMSSALSETLVNTRRDVLIATKISEIDNILATAKQEIHRLEMEYILSYFDLTDPKGEIWDGSVIDARNNNNRIPFEEWHNWFYEKPILDPPPCPSNPNLVSEWWAEAFVIKITFRHIKNEVSFPRLESRDFDLPVWGHFSFWPPFDSQARQTATTSPQLNFLKNPSYAIIDLIRHIENLQLEFIKTVELYFGAP